MKSVLVSLFSLLLFSSCFSFGQIHKKIDIGPSVHSVYSGPIKGTDDGGERFRLVAVLSEVYISLFGQKIQYGSENCCAKIVSSYDIGLKRLKDKQSFFDISDVKMAKL